MYERLSAFWGVEYDRTEASMRHNSIQSKGREKTFGGDLISLVLNESILRSMDEEYRRSIGSCEIAPGVHMQW